MPQAFTAAQTLHLHQLQKALATALHGGKAPIVARAAQELGVSTGTVQRWLATHMGRETGRRRRADAGQRSVSGDDLEAISAALMGTFRQTGTRIMTFDTAVDMLRAEGVISTQLSASRLATVLTERGLHPSQLTRPTPAIEQRSLHANHVWQVDASVCVAYYLSNATGLQVLDEKTFYKNKPQHLTRVQQERLIRYTLADHYTHELLTRYYLGSECAAHLSEFLIWGFAPKTDAAGASAHVMHGVPLIVQMDMGSANTSATVLNLLERLQVRSMVHERHNSRANGSVEKGHHLVEVNFESALRFARVADLDDLNAKALVWANWFGATRQHSRYRNTRHALWLTITAEQLRLAPALDVMRELVTSRPVQRRVSNNLTVAFAVKGYGSQDYDVRYVPGVLAGSKVDVVLSPYRVPAIDVGYADGVAGEQRWITVEPNARGEDGRLESAPVIGEELRAAHRGLLEHNRDAVLQRAYGGDPLVQQAAAAGATKAERAEAAAKAQEAGALVFGGTVDPFRRAAEAALPAFLPKRGTALDAPLRAVEPARLSVVEACKRIRDGLGRIGSTDAYDPQAVYPWLVQRFGDAGVPEDQIEAICAQIAQTAAGDGAARDAPDAQPLRAVGGNGL